jgi:hypothetical protein
MTLEVRVLASEFASVMGASLSLFGRKRRQASYGRITSPFHMKWEFELTHGLTTVSLVGGEEGLVQLSSPLQEGITWVLHRRPTYSHQLASRRFVAG